MSATRQKQFTGRHMLMITIAFFGVIIGVNAFMAVSASRTWTGLVVANSYVASQEFQVKADAAQAQNAAGWTMDVEHDAGMLVVRLLDDGRPIEVSDVSAFVRRPVGGHDDATVPLAAAGNGFVGPIALAPGVWDITVTTGTTELGPIERETRITVE